MPKSLHLRLLVCIGLGWAALIAISLLTVYASDSELVDASNLEHLEYEAELIANQVQNSINTRQEALGRLAAQIDAKRKEGSASQEEVEQLLSSNDMALAMFARIGVISEQGRVTAQHPDLEGLLGLSVADRDFFVSATKLRAPTISKPIISVINGRSLVVLTHPLRDGQNQFSGIVAAAFDIRSSQFFDRLEGIRIGRDGYASLMTSGGMMLSHPDESVVLQAADSVVPESQLDMALLGWEGSGSGKMPDGKMELQAFAQVREPSWVVRTSMPVSQAAAPIYRLRVRLWVIGILSSLLMLPLLWWLMRQALKPLHALEDQIMQIGDGKSDKVMLRTSMDEMQQLASTFNNLERERQKARGRLKQREAFLNAVLNGSPIGIFIANEKGLVIYGNQALEAMTGHRQDAASPSAPSEHIHPDDRKDFEDLWWHAVDTKGDFLRQVRYQHANGSTLWIEAQASSVWDQGTLLGYAGIMKDITQRREDDAERVWEAEHDPLTGLLNRRGFERRLEEVAKAQRSDGEPAALLTFDLDHFKPINDEGGHDIGDNMLVAVSQAMKKVCRRGDFLARQGGDEFAIVLPSCTLSNAQRVTEQLRQEVSQLRIMAKERSYAVTLSLGLTALHTSDSSINEPIKRADIASYEAKENGRNRIVSS